jgi:4-amino-4-deoxy-L-arabinose transferase-like glycosyltransferase
MSTDSATAPRNNNPLHVVVLVLLCLLPIGIYLPLLATPFNADEGFYATVAQMILHDGVPYRDAFDNKPPLVFGWYAISFLIFGEHVWAPRLVVAILLSWTVTLVYVQGLLTFSRSAGLIAAAAFALSIGITKFETNAQTEYFMLPPMVGSLVAFTLARKRASLKLYFIAGLLAGLSIITRQTAVFPFAAVVLHALLSRDSATSEWSPGRFGPALTMTAGALAVGIAVGSLFLAVGAESDLWDAVVVYGWKYSRDTPLYVTALGLLTNVPVLAVIAGPWTFLAGLGVRHVLRDDRRPETLLLVWWLVGAVLAVAAGGRYYHHYFVQLLPALALLCPAGIALLAPLWHRWTTRLVVYPFAVFGIVATVVLNGGVLVKGTPEARHMQIYPGFERAEWETESPELADYIREHVRGDEYIFNLGYQSELYFYSDRRPASRYMFDRLYDVDASLEAATLADLESRRPAMIIDSARYETQRESYPSELLRGFIQDNYELLGKVYYADVYLIRSP